MKIKLIVVGKTKEQYFQKSEDEYIKRLQRYARLKYKTLPEIKEHKGITTDQVKEKEAEYILKEISSSDCLILLDEKGKQKSSRAFSKWIQKKEMEGKDLIFLIGGPYGFSQQIYNKAQHKMSLSEMTFSHQMIRMFFLEQLYRAYTIKHGLPYHHD